GYAGLGDVDRALLELVAKVVQAGRVLSGGDARRSRSAHARQTVMILRRPHRLLEPMEIGGPVGALHLDRLRYAPRTVDVVHDGDVRPRPLARGLDRVDAVLVQLDVPEATLDHLG